MVALMGLLLIITEQYLQPTISNSISPLRELNWARMIGALSRLPRCGVSVRGVKQRLGRQPLMRRENRPSAPRHVPLCAVPAERVLKLSLPTLYGWIIMFYCLFHLWLNILAELTHFGDREFYKVRFAFLHGNTGTSAGVLLGGASSQRVD